MKDPWVMLKEESASMFLATSVAILASSIFQASGALEITSWVFWRTFFHVIISVLIAMSVVFAVAWTVHKLRHGISGARKIRQLRR